MTLTSILTPNPVTLAANGKPYVLFHSFMDKSVTPAQLHIRPLPNQPVFSDFLPEHVDSLVFTLDKAEFTRRPPGVLTVTSDYTMIEPMSLHVESFRPTIMVTGDPLLVANGLNEEFTAAPRLPGALPLPEQRPGLRAELRRGRGRQVRGLGLHPRLGPAQ